MLIFIEIALAKSKRAHFKYLEIEVVDNGIHHQGCFMLAQGKWPKLQTINLGMYFST